MIDRDRVVDTVSLSLLRLELKRALRPLMILAVGFAIMAWGVYYIIGHINGGIGSTHTMQFELDDVTGVVPGRAEARFYGIEAGTIMDSRLVNGHAILTVSVADKFGRIYKNATAVLRPNTALEDMYLDITNRGTPSAGVAGSNYIIPQDQTTSPVNLSAVLNTFQPDVRTQLYNVLDQFGNGLADHGADLKRAFTLVAPFIQIAGNVATQLADRASLTKHLVHNASVLSALLASRSTQLRQFVTDGTRTLVSLSTDGGVPLRQTIDELGSSLGTVNDTWSALHALLPNAQRAVAGLQPVANDLGGGLDSLRQFSLSARPALAKLEAPVQQLRPLANVLRPLASNLSSAIDQISPQVPDFDHVALNSAQCIAYIDEFFNWDYSMSKFYDNYGPMVRGNLHFGFYSVPEAKQSNYVPVKLCDNGKIPLGVNTPKYDGPASAP